MTENSFKQTQADYWKFYENARSDDPVEMVCNIYNAEAGEAIHNLLNTWVPVLISEAASLRILQNQIEFRMSKLPEQGKATQFQEGKRKILTELWDMLKQGEDICTVSD